MTQELTAVLTPIPYLPRLSWFVTLMSNSKVHWHVDEIYDKRHPRNRCYIATTNGRQQLTIPLSGGRNQKLPLNRIEIANDNWAKRHIHAMQTAYGSAPFFQFYANELFQIISEQHSDLAGLNLKLIETFLKFLKIEVEYFDLPTKPFHEAEVSVYYRQVFSERTGFIADCSIIDLLFNYGPDSKVILQKGLVG